MSGGWLLVRALHLLAFVVVPVHRQAEDRDRLRAVARRFGHGTLAAVAVLAATGAAMATHFHEWGERALQVKLGVVAAVGVLIVWHMRRPELRALDGAIFVSSLAIVWLGVTIAH